MSKNLMFHDRSKNIEIKYHYIRDMVQRGALKLQCVVTNEQIIDVFTKPIERVKLEYLGIRFKLCRLISIARRKS